MSYSSPKRAFLCDAGIKSLDSAIEHGNLGHADLAKKCTL